MIDLTPYKRAVPELDESILNDWVELMPDRYFSRFSEDERISHLRHIAKLSDEHLCEIVFEQTAPQTCVCTVLSYDSRHLFSTITGILSARGMSIQSGVVFTARGRSDSRQRSSKRLIVDRFEARIPKIVSFEDWTQAIKISLLEAVRLLHSEVADAVTQVQQTVHRLAADELADRQGSWVEKPDGVDISVEQRPPYTTLTIQGADSPFFLYALSNALGLHQVSIEQLQIQTQGTTVVDTVDVLDYLGRPITDKDQLEDLTTAVRLTKQLSYFLGEAPDPYSALSRFDILTQKLMHLPRRKAWERLFKHPATFEGFARLLGASAYLWDELIQLHTQDLYPILQPYFEQSIPDDLTKSIPDRLEKAMTKASFDGKVDEINQFKDREILMADIYHIVGAWSLSQLSTHLTRLAEAVIRVASPLIYDHLSQDLGVPQAVDGTPTHYAVLGLGKFGGAELGYASDLEVMVVFEDTGHTDAKQVSNLYFFEQFVSTLNTVIWAKQDGIFKLDLRLRPHGEGGPLAVSLNSFCRYYGPGGSAHFYEHLALVRLRAICGGRDFGKRIERLRDEYVYSGSWQVDIESFHLLRQKQFQTKVGSGQFSAKFSGGALVDLEYTVQILQCRYARKFPDLKTPKLERAIDRLGRHEILKADQQKRLVGAYTFFRALVNACRMQTGSAKDVVLPPPETEASEQLARRMGYQRKDKLSGSRVLHLELQAHTAAIRTFVKTFFSYDALPSQEVFTAADIVMAPRMPKAVAIETVTQYGFQLPERAIKNLRYLARTGRRRFIFAQLAVLACDFLKHTPDPDMALNNWERLVNKVDDVDRLFKSWLGQPRKMEIAMALFASSQYLSDLLIRNPSWLDWVIQPRQLYQFLGCDDLKKRLEKKLKKADGNLDDWRHILREFKQQEMLRIGTKDICLKSRFEPVTHALSDLAEAIVGVALEHVCRENKENPATEPFHEILDHLLVLAFGKLGGRELNYSSDIDLLIFYDDRSIRSPEGRSVEAFLTQLINQFQKHLTDYTHLGRVYRVDLRLRPFGNSGSLLCQYSSLVNYYKKEAALWEIQALLKTRLIYGNKVSVEEFENQLEATLRLKRSTARVQKSVLHMRDLAQKHHDKKGDGALNVKTGLGGIRDIEFLVQALQLIYSHQNPDLLTPNTLAAIEKLSEAGFLKPDQAEVLIQHYIFLRRIEHFLQIYEDRQVHAVPKEITGLTALAKRMMGFEASPTQFQDQLTLVQTETRSLFSQILKESTD